MIEWSGGIGATSYGHWFVSDTSPRQCKWISPAASAVAQPGHTFSMFGHLEQIVSHDVVITWQLQSGATLGKKRYTYSHGYDYMNYGVDLRTEGTYGGIYGFAVIY